MLSILLKIQFIYQFLTLCVNIVFTLLESQVSVDCILFYRQVFCSFSEQIVIKIVKESINIVSTFIKKGFAFLILFVRRMKKKLK